jgi:GTPase
MVHSAFQAVKNADIVLLLVDGSSGRLSDQELKLAFYVFELYKGLIILFNKTDLMTEVAKAELTRELDFYDAFMRKIPQVYISCKTGANTGKIMPLADTVWQRYSQQFSDLELTQFFKDALAEKPLYHQSKLLLLYKAEQVKTAPITIVLFVNEPAWFGPSQLAFFENSMRQRYDLKGVPVHFIPRKR